MAQNVYLYLLVLFFLGTAMIERSGRTRPVELWVIFFFGFFFAMVCGLPVIHWLGHEITDLYQQPPGKPGPNGGGGS
jgi:hypothetical protein